jgi:hypothetical protein
VPQVRLTCPGVPWSVPGPKKMGDPDFLPRGTTAFIKESRMKFANASKLDRKSGGSPTTALAECASLLLATALMLCVRARL